VGGGGGGVVVIFYLTGARGFFFMWGKGTAHTEYRVGGKGGPSHPIEWGEKKHFPFSLGKRRKKKKMVGEGGVKKGKSKYRSLGTLKTKETEK